jgi:hypothetical protein
VSEAGAEEDRLKNLSCAVASLSSDVVATSNSRQILGKAAECGETEKGVVWRSGSSKARPAVGKRRLAR